MVAKAHGLMPSSNPAPSTMPALSPEYRDSICAPALARCASFITCHPDRTGMAIVRSTRSCRAFAVIWFFTRAPAWVKTAGPTWCRAGSTSNWRHNDSFHRAPSGVSMSASSTFNPTTSRMLRSMSRVRSQSWHPGLWKKTTSNSSAVETAASLDSAAGGCEAGTWLAGGGSTLTREAKLVRGFPCFAESGRNAATMRVHSVPNHSRFA